MYCQQPITTFDNIRVRFRESDFDHCMFESSKRDWTKDKFSAERAQRIDWIKATLIDASADLRQGWDRTPIMRLTEACGELLECGGSAS